MKEKEIKDVPIRKSLAFKASFESDDLEDDIALISHKFKDFLKERRIQKKDKKKKRKIKKKKALQATWDDSSTDEESSSDGEVATHALWLHLVRYHL